MIKLVCTVDRPSGMAEGEFYERWLMRHGPLVASHAEAIRARRYVQSHTIDSSANERLRASRGMQPPLAGIAEVWWDSLDDLQTALADPAGRVALAELASSAASFVHRAGSEAFLTVEHSIFDYTDEPPHGTPSIKCTYLLRRHEYVSLAAFQNTWLNDHGPLVRSLSKPLGLARYVQSHTTQPAINDRLAHDHGLAAPLDGITEVWLADPVAATPATADVVVAAGATLIQDEARFIDMARSRCFMTTEHVIFDSTGASSETHTRTGSRRLAPESNDDAGR